jgi:hypothetical protein
VLQHSPRVSTEHAVKGFLRNLSKVVRLESNIGLAIPAAKLKNRGPERPEGAITASFVTVGRPASGKNGKDEHAFISPVER